MAITLEEVKHVALLARLELNEAELMAFQKELNLLLLYFEQLEQAPDGPVRMRIGERENVFALDQVEMGLDREEALRSASLTRAGLFVVPTIFED